MKKILTPLIYSILIMALLAEAGLFWYLYKEDKERTNTIVEIATESNEGRRATGKTKNFVTEETKEKGFCVLVKELPVYAQNDISVNTESKELAMLKRGETVELITEGNPYSLIRYGSSGEGYVWNDCIRAKSECDEFAVTRPVVVIDAGHQKNADEEEEPIGPGETETKAKTTAGTQGVSTKIPEHELNLEIALRLEALLKDDYTVVMVRRTADVEISNKERAMLANNIKADAFIRLHADGSESSEARGAKTICNKSDSKYDDVRLRYSSNRKLASCILDAYVEETGLEKREIMESDAYSGINWCSVPVTIVEMGYMTNPDEDQMMKRPEFQKKMAKGIAKGIAAYFSSPNVE